MRRADLFKHDKLDSVEACRERASCYLGYDVSRETFPAQGDGS